VFFIRIVLKRLHGMFIRNYGNCRQLLNSFVYLLITLLLYYISFIHYVVILNIAKLHNDKDTLNGGKENRPPESERNNLHNIPEIISLMPFWCFLIIVSKDNVVCAFLHWLYWLSSVRAPEFRNLCLFFHHARSHV
jgi:hypothetical protein